MPRTPVQNSAIKKATKKSIKSAALQLFGENGFERTTVSQIAKKAQVSTGLMYSYFEGKEDLVITIFKDFLVDHYALWSKRIAEASCPYEKLTIAIDRYIEPLKEDINEWSLIRELSSKKEFKEEFWKLVTPIRNTYKEELKPVFESLGLDPEIEFWSMQTYLEGISLCCYSYGDKYPLDAMRQNYLNRFIILKNK